MLIQLPPDTPLADAPAPVLDNQQRPRVDSSGILQGVGRLAQAGQQTLIQSEPFMAPGRGMEALGRGVGDAGAFFKAYADKIAEVRNRNDVMKAENAISSKIAQLAIERPRTDPRAWLKMFDEVMPEFLQGLTDGVSRDAANMIRLRGGNIINHARINTAQDAATEEFGMLRDNYEARINTAVDTGNYEVAKAISKEAVGVGARTESQHARLESQVIPGHQKQAERDTEAALYRSYQDQAILVTETVGQKGGEDLINSLSHVDPSDRERLKDVVRGVARDKTAALADEIANNTFSDPKDPAHIHSAHDLEAKYANSPFATPEFLANAKADLAKIDALKAKEIRNGPQGFTKFTAAYIDALKWEPPADPNLAAEQFREKMTNVRAYVPDDYQGEVTGVLHQKFGSQYQDNGKQRPAALREVTQILTPQFTRALDPILAIYNKRIAAYRESEKEEDKQKAEQMARVINNMQASNIAVQAQIEREVAEWYKEQPKPPTAQEVKEYTQSRIPDGMSVTSMQAFHDDGFIGPEQGSAADVDEDTDGTGGASMLPAGTIVNPTPPVKKPTSKKESQNPPLPEDPDFVGPRTASGGPSTILLPEMAPAR